MAIFRLGLKFFKSSKKWNFGPVEHVFKSQASPTMTIRVVYIDTASKKALILYLSSEGKGPLSNPKINYFGSGAAIEEPKVASFSMKHSRA